MHRKWAAWLGPSLATGLAACDAAPPEEPASPVPTVAAESPAPGPDGDRTGEPLGNGVAHGGCSAEQPRTCYREALRVRGHGKARRAAALLELACDGSVLAACNTLGRMLEVGRGIPAEPARGRELLERACRKDYQVACDALGH